MSSPGDEKGFAFFNNHVWANAAANAIILLQELGQDVKLGEALKSKFPQLGNESA